MRISTFIGIRIQIMWLTQKKQIQIQIQKQIQIQIPASLHMPKYIHLFWIKTSDLKLKKIDK